MFLKKLEISGFKSFANKTVLDFLNNSENKNSQGITAIVGPNGSGKSNIADALRWVLGEQSMRKLRSKKSQDIIFAGSRKKARLGSAWVTLYLDNSDKKLPLDFQEVAIRRKLFRSGEAEYLINGSRVRLQDITDILAKAGIGKGSFTIINQGMADAILNATPLERKAVIENAAGVKQYQIKKERSLHKLDLTNQNLEKVHGLIQEIKPHLNFLKRQATKAVQGKTISQELEEKQSKLYSFLWHNFQEEKNKLTEAKNEKGRVMMNIQREVDNLTDKVSQESQLNRNNEQQTKLEIKLEKTRNILNQLEKDLMIAEGQVEIEKEKLKSLKVIEEIKIKNIPVNLNYVKLELEKIKEEQAKLVNRLKNIKKLEEAQKIREFAQAIQRKLSDLKTEIEKGKKEEKIKNSSQPKSIFKEDNSKKIEDLQKKIVEVRNKIENYKKQVREINSAIQNEVELNRLNRQKFFKAEQKLRVEQRELEKLKDQFNEAKIVLARMEVREDDLKNQIKQELKKEAHELSFVDKNINRSVLENEIYKLKIKMGQIGEIDPSVIDEYKETDERFKFLTAESQDLEKAISSLKKVVREMDEKIEKEFSSAYEEINREFSKYFKIIFGGGKANLFKLKIKNKKSKDAENIENEESVELEEKHKINETGVEIFACPPGKKISNLNMLSGGERSLTSLALLFAVIAYNPPPFAVLDEVEAALDEANSKRFGKILQELSKQTQFVAISHNRETMRQANILYGVTMGEDGISKILSVRLDQIGAKTKTV